MTSNKKIIQHLSINDVVMSALIQKIGRINLRPKRIQPFQSIMHAIIHQQLNGTVAKIIYDRFISLFGDGNFPTAGQIKNIDFEIMRSSGLSKPKTTYIKEVAEMALDGLVPTLEECDKLSDDEIKDQLLKIKGVGPWTADMLLIFNLGRLDVLPVHDLGVRKGFQMAYRKRKLPAPQQLEKFGRKWKPYRTMATLYLWRAVDSVDLNEWLK